MLHLTDTSIISLDRIWSDFCGAHVAHGRVLNRQFRSAQNGLWTALRHRGANH